MSCLSAYMSSSPSLEILSQSMHLLAVTVNIYCAFSAVDVLTILCYALSYLSLCGCVHQLILHLNIDKSAENTTRLENACKGKNSCLALKTSENGSKHVIVCGKDEGFMNSMTNLWFQKQW